MTTPSVSPIVPLTVRQRVRACLGRRHHVEQLSLIALMMVIQLVVELHAYSALGWVSVLSIGLRDFVLVLLFAEEEGILYPPARQVVRTTTPEE